jgi:hypothetical protein
MSPGRGSTPRRTDWLTVSCNVTLTWLDSENRTATSHWPLAQRRSAGSPVPARQSQPATAGKISVAPHLTRLTGKNSAAPHLARYTGKSSAAAAGVHRHSTGCTQYGPFQGLQHLTGYWADCHLFSPTTAYAACLPARLHTQLNRHCYVVVSSCIDIPQWFIHNLKAALIIYHNFQHTCWDESHPLLAMAFNFAWYGSTGTTTAPLYLGRELNQPLRLK